MKNILILADGSIAKHFLEWVDKKRVAENHYYVTYYHEEVLPEKLGKNITLIEADPTSFSKLDKIMMEVSYTLIFIVMQDIDDAKYALNNIQLLDDKARIVLVNQWDNETVGEGLENVTLLHADDLVASHLYDHLPNVPVVAQNVGLGQGEIMEVHVPFGSTYAFRHVGSILQRKWKIAAIYRNDKQILPNNATMIRPNDTLLILGKPIVLNGVYKTINKRIGLFPEPFGRDLFLILDLRFDHDNALIYLKESIYLLEKLEDKKLYVRILYPNDFKLVEELKAYETEHIIIATCYDDKDIKMLIEYDIQQYDIGLVLNSIERFESEDLKETLYELRKIVYLFGDDLLYNIKEAIVLMENEQEKMESISSTAFDISESLDLKLSLCDFDPEGDFDSKKIIIEHYETLTHIFGMDIHIEQKIANPIRELDRMIDVMQIVAFEKELNTYHFMRLISTRVRDFLLTTRKHPKLLVPFALSEGQ
ncbi:hypothetical protein YH65_05440 [Sulfurovum lithotrophicum]|uniref:RCK C-terminal domain-containing protein n=1 Tax=Sulfurovum lithotrophicum TaxID=206403 RepID=A0A7U4M103_9BACT|nr:hypothetical protein [Sulfurovum lithotrophicum]AKF24893.1 hypothetical protein YH65_05440 [Sulfurovum lithotrophicum]